MKAISIILYLGVISASGQALDNPLEAVNQAVKNWKPDSTCQKSGIYVDEDSYKDFQAVDSKKSDLKRGLYIDCDILNLGLAKKGRLVDSVQNAFFYRECKNKSGQTIFAVWDSRESEEKDYPNKTPQFAKEAWTIDIQKEKFIYVSSKSAICEPYEPWED